MEFALIVIVAVIVLAFLMVASSFEPRTIRIAMNALKDTVDTFPEDSSEYFPPPTIVKATLQQNFFPQQMKMSLQRDYGVARPEDAAYHLLDIVGHLFKSNSNPHMAAWFLAARDSLRKRAAS